MHRNCILIQLQCQIFQQIKREAALWNGKTVDFEIRQIILNLASALLVKLLISDFFSYLRLVTGVLKLEGICRVLEGSKYCLAQYLKYSDYIFLKCQFFSHSLPFSLLKMAYLEGILLIQHICLFSPTKKHQDKQTKSGKKCFIVDLSFFVVI